MRQFNLAYVELKDLGLTEDSLSEILSYDYELPLYTPKILQPNRYPSSYRRNLKLHFGKKEKVDFEWPSEEEFNKLPKDV